MYNRIFLHLKTTRTCSHETKCVACYAELERVNLQCEGVNNGSYIMFSITDEIHHRRCCLFQFSWKGDKMKKVTVEE